MTLRISDYCFLVIVALCVHNVVDAYVVCNASVYNSSTYIPKHRLLRFHDSRLNLSVTDYCFEKLHQFAVESSQFTNCIVEFARPIAMCRMCSDEYNNTLNVYNDIKDSNTCGEALLNGDRIQIVEKTYEETIFMWETANCDNCYVDNKSPYTLKNSTEHFFTLVNKTLTCFIEANATVCPLDNNHTYCPNAACTSCVDIYQELNHYYRSIQEKYDFENLCMDITDSMNSTRKMWSLTLDCIHNANDTFVLFVVISFMCLFPIVFYLSNWLHSDEHKSKIVPQKRLATSRSFAQLSVNSNHFAY